jgi:hypothetical protein
MLCTELDSQSVAGHILLTMLNPSLPVVLQSASLSPLMHLNNHRHPTFPRARVRVPHSTAPTLIRVITLIIKKRSGHFYTRLAPTVNLRWM